MKDSSLSHTETERYTAIIEAAEQLFGKRGFHDVSLDEISRTAGVSKGLVSYHFGSKEDLLAHILNRARVRLLEKLDVISRSKNTAKAKLSAAVQVYLEAASARLALTQMAISSYLEGSYAERIKDLWAASLEDNLLKFSGLIDDGIARGELKTVDSRLITHFVIGMVFEMIRVSIVQQKPVQPDKLTADIIKVLFDGISR